MEREFNKLPVDPKERVRGFEQAIEATKKTIKEYRADGADTSELEVHLRGLERGLAGAESDIKKTG